MFDPGRLVDLRVGGAEPEDEQDHAREHEHAADDAAQVEQVGGARSWSASLRLLGLEMNLSSGIVVS